MHQNLVYVMLSILAIPGLSLAAEQGCAPFFRRERTTYRTIDNAKLNFERLFEKEDTAIPSNDEVPTPDTQIRTEAKPLSQFKNYFQQKGVLRKGENIFPGAALFLPRTLIKELPEGTLLWSIYGERKIVGSTHDQKDYMADPDFHWGLRPRPMDLEPSTSYEQHRVGIPKDLNSNEMLALNLLYNYDPSFFAPRARASHASMAQKDVLKIIANMNSPLSAFPRGREAYFVGRIISSTRQARAFWKTQGLLRDFQLARKSVPEMFSPKSPLSLVDIYRELRISNEYCMCEKEVFDILKILKSGTRLLDRIPDGISRGPLLLLTNKKIQALPRGTVIWNTNGQHQIIGVEKLRLDEDFHWGVRPLNNEFDTKIEAARFYPVPLPRMENVESKIAIFIIESMWPELLRGKTTASLAQSSAEQITALANLLVSTRARHKKLFREFLKDNGMDFAPFWEALGVKKMTIEEILQSPLSIATIYRQKSPAGS